MTDSYYIPPEFTIFLAADTKPRLMSAVHDGRPLNFSQVTEIDTAGIQLLLLALHEAEKLGITLEFHAVPQVARDLMTLFHLNELLALCKPEATHEA